ncbi:MAG: D-alanyl-D-alanine carboxypeptidase [Alphaproteobacteria bacterium]|nr:D-alanyl-D-alanine carboxypeptidase [Alphaproteobacteria bacterium]
MKKTIVILALMAFFCADAKVKAKAKEKSFINAKYAVLMDFETGDRLFELKSDEVCAPSSMTKLMTIYLLFSAIAEHRINMDDEFPVSLIAQKMTGSRSFFKAGDTAKVEDLIRSIIVHSGNDACIVVAEGLAGDIDTFVEMMNEQAKKFNLQNTNFENPNGLPDDNHYSCVADIACIARHIIQDFPQFYHYFSEKEFTVNGITQQNRNTLLGNSLGVDGLKTGKTDAGGYGIAVSAKKGGKRLIAVVNGCKSMKNRAQDASKLLAMGFKLFDSFMIAKAGQPVTTLRVWLGNKDSINVCAHENISVSIPKKYSKELRVEAIMKEPLDAPIKIGDKVGKLVYKYADFQSKEYDLFACESVEKAGIFERAKITLRRLIFGDLDTQVEASK